jgi:hypothetical protein
MKPRTWAIAAFGALLLFVGLAGKACMEWVVNCFGPNTRC